MHVPVKQLVAQTVRKWTLKKQRETFDRAAQELGIQTQSDWYSVSSQSIRSRGLKHLIRSRYNQSIHEALKTVYPEFQWSKWYFANIAPGTFDQHNHRSYFDWLTYELDIETQPEIYHKIDADVINAYGGASLLVLYNKSATKAIMHAYPEFTWHPWLFSSAGHGFWQDISNQRKFFDWVAEQLGIETMQQWTSVSLHSIRDLSPSVGVLRLYGNSLKKALETIYEGYKWSPPAIVARWAQHHNQRKYFDWVAEHYNITKQSEWYQYQTSHVDKLGVGGSLIHNYHKSNLGTALESIYPEYEWFPWLFPVAPHGYWTNDQNIRKYFNWLSDKLGIHTQDEWYKRSTPELMQHNGSGVYWHFLNAARNVPHGEIDLNVISTALQVAYPEYIWYPWDFATISKGWWMNKENQLAFIQNLAEELQFTRPEDWYSITSLELRKRKERVAGLTRQYNFSLIAALRALYPEANLLPWCFTVCPRSFWKSEKNVKEWLDWAAIKLEINHFSDWYRVSYVQLGQLGGTGVIRSKLPRILAKFFPEHKWDLKSFKFNQKTQALLHMSTKSLLPDFTVQMNYKHPQLKYESRMSMELDVFVPELGLALEYQGEHHYYDFNCGFYGEFESVAKNDIEKRRACKEHGITLISIPFWWDAQKDSLQATIHEHRPDIFPESGPGTPISPYHPSHFSFTGTYFPFFEHTQHHKSFSSILNDDEVDTQNNNKNSNNEWNVMKQKMGVRVLWDGEKLFLTNGSIIKPPASFSRLLPNAFLDGVLSL